MGDEPSVITSYLALRTIELTETDEQSFGQRTEQGVLWYDLAEPYGVALLRPVHWGMSWWRFSRDLLAAGLLDTVGEGQVRVGPGLESGQLRFDLRSPITSIVADARMVDVAAFLQLTHDAVPVGSEGKTLDLDGELARLMS